MSNIFGRTAYGSSNITQTNAVTAAYDGLQTQIIQNADDIADNTEAIDDAAVLINANANSIAVNTTSIDANTALISANTTSINALNTQCTDITYDLTSDTTTIANKLTVKAVNDWSSFINRRAQFVLTNDTTSTSNQYDTKIYAGATYGVATTSLISNVNGATCIVNTKTGATEDSTSIILCGHHASIKRGLKIALDGNISEYYGGSFVFYTDLFIQPTGKPMMDVYTHFFSLSQSYTNMSVIVTSNTANTTANTSAINAFNTELDAIAKMTYDAPSDTTDFDSRLWCQRDCFVADTAYGTISLVENRQKIVTIESVNATQASDISTNTASIGTNSASIVAIESVNGTQTSDISTNAAAIAVTTAITSLFTVASNILFTVGSVTQLIFNQNLSMATHDITNVGNLSTTTINGFALTNPSNVLRCKLLCDGSGVWSMTNNHGFIKFWSALGAGLGDYVEKDGVGRISVLLGIDKFNTDVSVTATGIKNTPSTSYFDIMQISPVFKAYYDVSGVEGVSLQLLCASLNAGVLTDISSTGYIDLVIHY
jgi:hypothetical protein